MTIPLVFSAKMCRMSAGVGFSIFDSSSRASCSQKYNLAAVSLCFRSIVSPHVIAARTLERSSSAPLRAPVELVQGVKRGIGNDHVIKYIDA